MIFKAILSLQTRSDQSKEQAMNAGAREGHGLKSTDIVTPSCRLLLASSIQIPASVLLRST